MVWRIRTGRHRTAPTNGADSPAVARDKTDPAPVDVFLLPAFLSELECVGLRAEMDSVAQVAGGVRETDRPDADSIDRAGRSARECQVSDDTTRSITQRICQVAPEIGAHFNEELAEYETPHFIVYTQGDFYRSHRDLYPDVVVPEPIARRRVAVVIFLNDETDPNRRGERGGAMPMERYAGGTLRLCSHEAPEFVSDHASNVPARRGVLVAFRADTWHEVTPITDGRRFTIVALLLAPKP
jgi:SM-20-related protein